MKTIIIEDEKPASRLLQRKLEKLNVRVEVMLHSVQEAIEWFSNNEHPDLIFLDIQLSDGLSFELFEKVEIKSAVIFTTAYDEYALKTEAGVHDSLMIVFSPAWRQSPRAAAWLRLQMPARTPAAAAPGVPHRRRPCATPARRGSPAQAARLGEAP